jgi:eukaryotic-like serine/threonine-protein kinase
MVPESQPPAPNRRAVPGTVIGGRYELRAAIGNGGMGTVWQAADRLLRRDVAVKEVLFPAGMAEEDRTAMYERTLREARAAAALSHPSVVQVYDVVTEAGRPWIVMELLHARSLADLIISDGPLAPRAVAKIGVALLGALEVAHSAGVLHRDVKPANVLICTDGRCVLTDFGVARMPAESNLTTPGMVLGSPHFISPERAVGGRFGPPSDLFSLGVSLFTAVEGRPPFDRGDPFETMRAVVEEPPARPVRAGALAPVLYGLLEKDPVRRWDVTRARGVLRELLAGPLANNAVHHVTDPYAVVPPAPGPAPRLAEAPSGQIGGRAMLAPGELPTDRQPPPPPLPPPPLPVAGAHAAAPGLVDHLRRLSPRARLGLAGGLAAVVLAATLGAATVFSGNSQPRATVTQRPSPTGPPFPVQAFSDSLHGFALDVPAGWKKQASGTYYDFVDPADRNRTLRVNVERAGGSAADFIKAVAKEQARPGKCGPSFTEIAERDVMLAGRPAAELEYICSQGGDVQHVLWRATVLGGKAYEFRLTVADSRFTESRVIYDHAVESYHLNKSS